MCGIIGRVALRTHDDGEAARREIARRAACLNHRGPDHRGVAAVGERLLFGHTRLSIIDPTDENNQPFRLGSCHLCFNGEIFNFKQLREELRAQGVRFGTSGDCEVILAGYLAWGEAIFARIKGMYAIALFDERESVLHLARDVFGIKPLYLREHDGALWFGSEIKALPGPVTIDAEGFSDLVSFGYHFGCASLYAGVTSLEPGARIRIVLDPSDARRTVHRDKTLQDIATGAPDGRDLAETLRSAVEDHLISDVPVASTLSGGLDSSIVTALAKGADSDITAYTNTLWPEGDAETEHASLLARELGIAHRVLHTPLDDLHETVSAISRHVEEPIVNSAVFNSYALAAQLRADGYKVALVGEGSDELFAGYPWHAWPLSGFDRESMFRELRTRRAVQAEPPAWLTQAGRDAFEARKDEQRRIFLDEMETDVGSDFNRFLMFDTRHQLVTMQLQRIDRLFMAHGIEARVPFLYDDVLRHAFSLAPSQRLDLSEDNAGRLRRDKLCLALAFADRLPRRIVERPKFGKGGSANLGVTPPMKQWPSVFERVLTDPRWTAGRDFASPFIDWSALAEARTERKEQMFLSMLVMAATQLAEPGSATAVQ